MDSNIFFAVAFLDKDVLECLDNNYKDYFDVDFLLVHLLVYLLQGTLGGKCIVHHGYMNKIVWYETYVYFSHEHE